MNDMTITALLQMAVAKRPSNAIPTLGLDFPRIGPYDEAMFNNLGTCGMPPIRNHGPDLAQFTVE